jgi:hypothetical protein
MLAVNETQSLLMSVHARNPCRATACICRLDTTTAQVKVDLLQASVWLSLGAGLVTPLGGYATYTHLIHEVTQGGSATDNLTFVWLLLLVYYTVKGGVMSVATGWRAMAAHAAEPEVLQELEQLQVRPALVCAAC